MPARTDQLTSYVEALRDEVSAALRALLDLGAEVEAAWDVWVEDAARGTRRLRVTVRSDERQVEFNLLIRRSGDRTALEAQRSRVPYRRLGDLDLEADFRLERHLAAAFARALPTARTRLVAALDAWTRHDGLGDWMYRQVAGSHGTVASIRLGFRCNQRCRFCWQGRAWPEPPADLLRRWIEEFAALGITALTITGGEPTLHPDLVELVRLAAREHHFLVTLQTNAIKLADAAFVDALFAAGVQGVMVSYHSADPEVSDAMTGVRGSHRRTVEGIVACLARAAEGGQEIRLNCVVERSNLAGLEAYARDVVERFVVPFGANGVRCVEFSFPSMSHDAERWRDAVVPLDELREPLVAATRVLKAANVDVELFSGCGFPACVLCDAPELVEPVERERLDAKDLEGRTWGAACAACALRQGCLGLRNEYVEVHGERGVVPFTTFEPPAGK